MNILILGYSKIFQSRVWPALRKIESIKKIDIASFTSKKENVNGLISGCFYNDYEEALAKSNADIVYITIKNSDHLFWVKESLNRGFHVIVDKPAFLNKSDALEMINLAKNKNKCLAEALVYQYHPQIREIKNQFIKYKTEPNNISAFFSFPNFGNDNFRNSISNGGGAIYDLGPYAMSIGRFIFDELPKNIWAISNKLNSNLNLKVDTNFTIMMEFSNSKSFIGHFGFGTEYINNITVLGGGINVKLDRVFTTVANQESNLIIYKGNDLIEIIIKPSDSFQLFIEDVLCAVKNNNFENHYKEVESNATLLDELINLI